MNTYIIKSALALIGGLGVAVGGNLLVANDWSEISTPAGIGRLIVTAGGVLISWFGPAPMRGKNV